MCKGPWEVDAQIAPVAIQKGMEIPSRLGKPISYVAVPRGKSDRLAVGNLYADVFRGTTECSKGRGAFRPTSNASSS